MSRSYRRPFASVCGKVSAKKDKQLAHRGVRRVQNRIARLMADDPDLLMPHFRACPWNNPYSWSRDGKQRPQWPDARDWSNHMMAVLELWEGTHRNEYYLPWPPEYYAEMTRK